MTAATIDRCYWTAFAGNSGSPSLRGEAEADFAIIGGGIVGIIAARLLKDRIYRVAVVESGRIGRGVTGRSTAKVTFAVPLRSIRLAPTRARSWMSMGVRQESTSPKMARCAPCPLFAHTWAAHSDGTRSTGLGTAHAMVRDSLVMDVWSTGRPSNR